MRAAVSHERDLSEAISLSHTQAQATVALLFGIAFYYCICNEATGDLDRDYIKW